ncbi:MAG: protein-L-isoaspartate(D-aspartate) O-methyltransferase [Elusimicrobiota bacterium]
MNRIILSVFFILCLFSCKTNSISDRKSVDDTDRYYKASVAMVETQLKTRDITDKKVLQAMLKVERYKFVPKQYQKNAYDDTPLPIGYGQTISQPYIVALMTQLLNLKGNEKVLEIGTGSGYQAAILAELCKNGGAVYTIEIIPELGKGAEKLLNTMGYKNISVKIDDGYLGWPEYAPFDGIIVTCAPDEIPQPLIDQLKDSGKMVIPVGEFWQELILVKKIKGKIIKKSIIPVRFVPMIRKE